MIVESKLEELTEIEHALSVRMKDSPRRLTHSFGVADTAAELARVYSIDEFDARAAGLLHDWDKVLPEEEVLARAAQYGITVCGSSAKAAPLLHGPVAARELPFIFPELPASVFQAIERHTVGAVDMTPLDMAVFIADSIEPNRKGDYAVELRELVGEIELEDLFFRCFTQGICYVISGGRYLYPAAIDIYNTYAARRSR